MDERFVGVVIKDGNIVDLMVYHRPDECRDNLLEAFKREDGDLAELIRAYGNGDGTELLERMVR